MRLNFKFQILKMMKMKSNKHWIVWIHHFLSFQIKEILIMPNQKLHRCSYLNKEILILRKEIFKRRDYHMKFRNLR